MSFFLPLLPILLFNVSHASWFGGPSVHLSGYFTRPPELNPKKTQALPKDVFSFYRLGLTGYVRPPKAGTIVLRVTEVESGLEPEFSEGKETIHKNQEISVPEGAPDGSRYFLRYELTPTETERGRVKLRYEIRFISADKTIDQLMFRSRDPSYDWMKEEAGRWDLFDGFNEGKVPHDRWEDQAERGVAYARRQNWDAALADLKESLAKFKAERITPAPGGAKDPSDFYAKVYFHFCRGLALVQYLKGDFAAADATLKELFDSPKYGSAQFDEASERSTLITGDVLFRWLLLRKQNKKTEATAYLQEKVAAAQAQQKLRQIELAQVLLGEKTGEEASVATRSGGGALRGAGPTELATVWAALGKQLNGKKEEAKAGLLKFLGQVRYPAFPLEKSIAYGALDIPCQERDEAPSLGFFHQVPLICRRR